MKKMLLIFMVMTICVTYFTACANISEPNTLVESTDDYVESNTIESDTIEDTTPLVDTDEKNTDNAESNTTADTDAPIITDDETQSGWDAVGGSEDPYKELYGIGVSAFLFIPGTFTDVQNSSEEYQELFNGVVNEHIKKYYAGTMDIPVLVEVIRGVGVSREELIVYFDALGVSYTDEVLDLLLSPDNDVVNEAFHSSLTLYHEGKIYTVYDLAEMNNTAKMSGAKIVDQFPEEKIAELYNNIQKFNEQSKKSVPSTVEEIYADMAVVAANTNVSVD